MSEETEAIKIEWMFKFLLIGILAIIAIVQGPPPGQDKFDQERAREVIIKIKKLKMGEPSFIDFNKYGLIHKGKINCVDYAFSFAALYGFNAEVIISNDHAFNRVNGAKIEPQQKGDFFIRAEEYRYPHFDYSVKKVIKTIQPEDVQKIKSYFGM